MGNACLDFELGRAVDNENTNARHQILSIEHHKRHDFYTLHYSVFHAYEDKPATFGVPDKFVEILGGKTPGKIEERNEMEKLFTDFMKQLRPSGKDAGFLPKEICYALTYDLHFTPDYQMTGFGMRPTLALMKEHMTCQEASEKAFAGMHSDKEMRICHDFALAMSNPQQQKKITFEEVTNRITGTIQREARKMAFKEGMDAVYHLNPEDVFLSHEDYLAVKNNPPQHVIGKYAHQYGSVLSTPGAEGPKRAVISTTASREQNAGFNIAVFHGFLANDGMNVFPKEIAKSVAKYNHHLLKWQMNPTSVTPKAA